MALIIHKDGNPSDRIATSVQRLLESSTRLNQASKELSDSIRLIDVALQKVNLGIASWVPFEENTQPDGSFTDNLLGYTKVNGRWGISIGIATGHRAQSERKIEKSLFNDAPRSLRAKAVDALPALIEQLIAAADETTNDITAKTEQARDIAKAITFSPQAKQ